MWKKSEEETYSKTPAPQPASPRPGARRELATIGPSISIKGDLTGDEDLMIQGRVDGEIRLKKNKVTIGKSGQVKADVYGKSIQVEGTVTGNLYGQDDVVVRASGRVQGNIVGPTVTLENGANFKGSIDMEPATPSAAPSSKPAAPQQSRTPSPAAADRAGDAQAELKPAPSRG